MHQVKFSFTLLAVSFITIFGLSNCGQQSSNKNNQTDSSKIITAQNPVIAADTMASSIKPAIGDSEQPTQQLPTTEKKKEKELVQNKTNGQPVGADKTPIEKPKATNPVNPTSGQTKEVAEVAKTPEIIKPSPQPEPKPVATPAPVVVATPVATPNEWVVPVKYKTMVNPYPVTSESISTGKSLYSIHCKSCHGSKGDGNGTKASQIETKINSFLDNEFRSQKEGAIFYKVSTGRKDMPGFSKKIPDAEERWAVVHYIMNL